MCSEPAGKVCQKLASTMMAGTSKDFPGEETGAGSVGKEAGGKWALCTKR